MSQTRPAVSIASFRFDVTPPLGHALLGGLIMPAAAHDDPLEGIGYVLLGASAPIVVCALDWAALMNESHLAWRTALATAAGTTPDRVAVHCVHQHNTPFVCATAREAARRHADLPEMHDPAFLDRCLERAQAAVRACLSGARRVTHVAHAAAEVSHVASNRRVARDAAGRVTAMRRSSCTDPALVALPEGRIDSRLQTLAFYGEDGRKLVACHYYACHPMSFYEDGRVTSDFCGLARKRRQAEEPGCTQVYFTGCAGDIGAGKYNDGSMAARLTLVARMHAAMAESESRLSPVPLESVAWDTADVAPTPLPLPDARTLEATLADPAQPKVTRLLAAFRLGWLRRCERGLPFVLSRLQLNRLAVLHLPGEMFVAYQLRAQALRPDTPVLVAAYGDDGLWYVPTRDEYPAGGYEVSVAFSTPEMDPRITAAIAQLLA